MNRRCRLVVLSGLIPLALTSFGRSQGVATPLDADCEHTAARLKLELGAECAIAVHPPFVIAGNLTDAQLEQWHSQTIAPAARAMGRSYFRTPPDQPITVLLFRDEESYRDFAKRVYGDAGVSIYGYYKPSERALVMNIGTGGGTLVHELTHALIAFDFPHVSDWFNEGLASLHEQCRFRSDESGIDGLPNWRLPLLVEAIRAKKLRSLESLIGEGDFRDGPVGLNYAQARYFCMYMQQCGVLERFYHRYRASHKDDLLGLAAVKHVFPNHTWDQLDADFRRWAGEIRSAE